MMFLNFFCRRFASTFFARAIDDVGAVALEFAIVLPVLLLCYFGGVQVSQLVAVNRMTALTVSTVLNIVTQYSSISVSQTIPDIFNAATAVLIPYPAANATVTVSSITINAQGQAAIAWSQSLNGSPRAVGQAVALPSSLTIPNTSVILGEITYHYQPSLDYLKIGSLNISSSLYMVPRNSSSIVLMP
jgi:Flp pilus assembly protein TadG